MPQLQVLSIFQYVQMLVSALVRAMLLLRLEIVEAVAGLRHCCIAHGIYTHFFCFIAFGPHF